MTFPRNEDIKAADWKNALVVVFFVQLWTINDTKLGTKTQRILLNSVKLIKMTKILQTI